MSEQTNSSEEEEVSFADDTVFGASNIAFLLWGDRKMARRVYYLFEKTNFPGWKLASRIAVRKSVIKEWVQSQEQNRAKPSTETQALDTEADTPPAEFKILGTAHLAVGGAVRRQPLFPTTTVKQKEDDR